MHPVVAAALITASATVIAALIAARWAAGRREPNAEPLLERLRVVGSEGAIEPQRSAEENSPPDQPTAGLPSDHTERRYLGLGDDELLAEFVTDLERLADPEDEVFIDDAAD